MRVIRARVGGLVAAGVTVVATVLVFPAGGTASAAPSCDANGGCTVEFGYSGSVQTFTVPAGITAVQLQVSGAEGGNAASGPTNQLVPAPGARGGYVAGSVTVTPGSRLTVLVGQRGTAGTGPTPATYGGGGTGGVGATGQNAGSGGGGSFVFAADGTLLAAAGGGGGGFGGVPGGAGSDDTDRGGDGKGNQQAADATGGTQTAGGAGSVGRSASGPAGAGPATTSAPGKGGTASSGGGGGGGYFGGGAGQSGTSGGGGSGYASPRLTVTHRADGANAGDGQVVIGYGQSGTGTPQPVPSPTTRCLSTIGDVAASSPFCADIRFLVSNRIATGYPDGGFHPAAPVTRQAVAAFLYRFLHHGVAAPTCGSAPFVDVPATSPFCPQIAALKTAGVLGGFADGTFEPTRTVSRQALAAFLYAVAHPGRTAPPCTRAAFPDVPTASAFCGAISALASAKIVTGYRDGRFHPASGVSRQATAAFLHRLAAS